MITFKTVLFTGAAGLVLFACSPASETSDTASGNAANVQAQTKPAPKPKPVETTPTKPVPVEPVATAPVVAPVVPKPISAKRLYLRRTCMACHGRNGGRGIQKYPNIAGLDASYIKKQVKDILSGKRQGSADDLTGAPRAESMRGALVTAEGDMRISDDEIKILATWLSEQTPAGPQMHEPALSAERIAEGEAVFVKGKCRTCHGVDGNKPLKGYPHLAGQKSAYIAAQLIDIRNGVRTNGRAKMMLPFVKKLTDDDMNAVADYLSQIDPGQ